MRLFTAILFDDPTKDLIASATEKLKETSARGRFVPRENLHLTLDFIGESAREKELRFVMERLSFPEFCIFFGEFGRFRRAGGDLYYLKVLESEALLKLESDLRAGLLSAGFKIEDKRYLPHVTLAREVFLKEDPRTPELAGGFSMPVRKISLMKSEQGENGIFYTEIFQKSAFAKICSIKARPVQTLIKTQISSQGSVFFLEGKGYRSIPAGEAKKMMEAGDAVIVDVRTKEEYDASHIEGSLLLPVTEILEKAAAILPKDRPLLLYCRSGRRSKQAAKMLSKLGYQNLFEFGGIINWPYGVVSD